MLRPTMTTHGPGVPTTRPSTAPEARSEATRTQILDASEALFAERGFAGTSMRAVAVAAGTSQALLHHHFGTKAGLYEAVKLRFTERYDRQRGSPDETHRPTIAVVQPLHELRLRSAGSRGLAPDNTGARCFTSVSIWAMDRIPHVGSITPPFAAVYRGRVFARGENP